MGSGRVVSGRKSFSEKGHAKIKPSGLGKSSASFSKGEPLTWDGIIYEVQFGLQSERRAANGWLPTFPLTGICIWNHLNA